MDNNQRYQKYEKPVSEFTDKVVQIKRVSKKNRVGVGLGKAKSVADAIQKGIKKAQKSLINVPIVNGTISGAVTLKFKGAVVMIRPGKKGSGLIAGGPVRAVVELAGIEDIVSKIVGSKNKSINVWAALKALSTLKK